MTVQELTEQQIKKNQAMARTWLQNLIKEARKRDLPEEMVPETIPDVGPVDQLLYELDTTGMEMVNMLDNPLQELMEEMPTPEKMTDEDLGQMLHSAWGQLSPTD